MATSAVQYNAAVTALAVLWQDYLDSLALGTQVKIYPVPGNLNGTALATGDFPKGGGGGANAEFGATGDGTLLTRCVHTIRVANSTSNMIYDLPGVELGRVPLFFKVNAGATESLANA